jgi:hypothetical protein
MGIPIPRSADPRLGPRSRRDVRATPGPRPLPAKLPRAKRPHAKRPHAKRPHAKRPHAKLSYARHRAERPLVARAIAAN